MKQLMRDRSVHRNRSVHRILCQCAAILGICCSLQIVSGCTPDNGDSDKLLSAGELVYEESFDSGEWSSHWNSKEEHWTVEDGHLRVSNAKNDALWLQHKLPQKVRIEFRARANSAEGDIKFEVFGDGKTHESGYVGIFGGWSNQLNIIARLDEHGDDRKVGADGERVTPNKWYDMAVVRVDSTVRWYVDGDEFMTYRDAAPLRGEEHRYFAFNDWEAPVTFDDVAVYDLEGVDE